MLRPTLKLVITIVAFISIASTFVAAKASERTRVIQICAQMYTPVVDQKRTLFSINGFYVLRLNFNRHGRLTQLAVEPKYYYADDHPDWEEPDNFPYLSKPEYERLLAEVDRIKPKGSLGKPASFMSVVTNMTARHRAIHRHGVLEWGELVDLRRGNDAPLLVRWFRVYYSIRRAT